MSTDKNKPTKQELLSELENIRASLSEGGAAASLNANTESDVSGLLSSVLDDVEQIEFDTMIKDHENTVKNTHNDTVSPSASKPLPGQQSLFSEPSESGTALKVSPPLAGKEPSDENPFLPQHIRERLSQSRNSFTADLTKVGNTLNKNPKPFSNDVPPNQIIDALVAKYLPIIEKELRERLANQLTSKDPSHKN